MKNLANKVTIDLTKGFDVLKGLKVVRHFDNYAEGWEYAREHHLTLRYWAKTEE